MHAILDAETDADLGLSRRDHQRAWWLAGCGRGPYRDDRARLRQRAKYATTRAGDPGPHDHVLIANVIQMKDAKGGTKAPDTTLWREHLHAATMVGRLASAKVAVDLGYGIEADGGPTGKLGHWKIKGIPTRRWRCTPNAPPRSPRPSPSAAFPPTGPGLVAARETRKQKRHSAVDDLVPMWRGELRPPVRAPPVGKRHRAGRSGVPAQPPVGSLESGAVRPRRRRVGPRRHIVGVEASRRDVIVALAPHLYGRSPAELDRAVSLCAA